MKTTSDARVLLGISLIRVSIVLSFLSALVSIAVPTFVILTFLGILTYAAGLIACLQGTGSVGKPKLLTALALLVMGLASIYLEAPLLKALLKLFGFVGFGLVVLVSPLLQISSLTASLLYLSELARYFEAPALGRHFSRLILALVVTTVLPVVGIFEPQNANLIFLSALVVGVMFVLSLSGSLAKLIKAAQAKAPAAAT